ncbi:hypothetical protein IJG29_02490 [Candidatus Saccharibacteria bacterium]|nr:hypothetical protein [Candidatus Saccharibacteria bacterium]
MDERTVSPAGMTRSTETKIREFNVAERLRNLERGKKILNIMSSQRLAAQH